MMNHKGTIMVKGVKKINAECTIQSKGYAWTEMEHLARDQG